MEKKRVVLSATAKSKLTVLLDYLESEWSEKVQQEFITKIHAGRNIIPRGG